MRLAAFVALAACGAASAPVVANRPPPAPVVGPELDEGTIFGRVLDATTGRPVAGANVIVTGPQLPRALGATSDVTGKYRVSHIARGTVLVTVRYAIYLEERVGITVGAHRALRVNLRVGPSSP